SEPTADVTVTIDGLGQVLLNGQPTLTLTFTVADWNVDQTVTLFVIDDPNDESPAGNTYAVVIPHTASSADLIYNELSPAPLTLTISETESAGIVFAPATLTVAESGLAETYTVALTSAPTANVTVTINGQGQVLLNGQPTLTLTFTPADWDTPQTVSVQAIDDLIDETPTGSSYDAILLHTFGGSDPVYAMQPSAPFTVTIIDNDNAGIVLTPTALTVAEGGPAETYTIALASEPTANVTVTIDGQGQVTLNGQPTLTLTFTPANWNTPQTVSVQAIDDLIDEAPVGTSYDITLLHIVGGGDPIYATLPPIPLTVTIIENDNAGLIFTPATLTIVEGSPGNYAITLTSEPSANVTVTIDGQGFLLINGNATAALTFTPANWNTPQTVSVLESDVEQIAQPARNRTVLHTTTSLDSTYNSLSVGLPVTVIDNDIPGIIPSAAELTITEGSIASYTIELATQPTANVNVTIDGQGVALINGVAVATLTFTPANWNTPQFVTIFVPDDNIAEATQTILLPHAATSADPFYDGLIGPVVELTILDNDPPGFIVTTPSTPLVVSENGDSVTIQIRLTSQPTAPVQLGVSVSNPAEGSVTPNSIIFDDTNWNTDAILIVSGVNDELDDGHQPFTVQFAPAISADPFYNGLTPATSLNFINRDNQPVRISINDVIRLEGNSGVANGNFVVRLNRVSDRDVQVDYVTIDGTATAGLDYNAIAGTLTIPADQLQVTLPVGIIGDTLAEDEEFFIVNLSNPRATLPGQPSIVASDETVVIEDGVGIGTIRDDDPPAVRFASNEFFVNESDGVATVTVTLSRAETTPVTVAYATVAGGTAQPGDGSDAAHDYAPVSGVLTFAPGVTSQSFTIPLWNNSFADAPFETILVALSGPTGAVLGDPATTTVTIIDSAPALLTQNPTALQTAGPNYTAYNWNFYGVNEGASIVRIDAPCGVNGDLTIELLSPSINPATNTHDVIRDLAETATFALYRMPAGWQTSNGYPPSTGTLVTSANYAPNTGDSTTWVNLPGIPSNTPCGIYLLVASVPNNDTNGWAVRSGWSGSGPPTVDLDGIPGSGDEITQGILRQNLRHPPGTPVCTTFYQYVAPGLSSVGFHNFDLEGNIPGRSWVRYYPPGSLYDPTGQTGGIAGTASADGQWNNGTATTRGGDVIASPQPGWWRIVTCTNSLVDENHFIQEGQSGVPLYLTPPPTPDLALSATPAAGSVPTGSNVTFNLSYTNQASGPTAGAARNLQLVITLPAGVNFSTGACASAPGVCSISGNTMTITVGNIVAGGGHTFSIPLTAGPIPVGAVPIAVQAAASDQIGNPYLWQTTAIVRVVP
uniref:Calx-beta domain-containing protein n=1 Tax=Chloroflexus sp. TaxID=1904827 RepID=UPI002ACDE241